MPESAVDRAVKEYRAMMDAREAAVVEQMTRQWYNVEKGIKAEMSELAYIIQQRRMAGETITDQMLWKMVHYQRLLIQANEQIEALNKAYTLEILGAQRDAFAIGVESANGLLKLNYQQAGVFSPFWERTDIRAVQNISALLQTGEPLHKLLEASYPTAIDGLKAALIEGVARGFTPSQIANNMADGFGMGLDRALLIAQTEVARAYRAGQAQQYRDSEVVERFYRFANKNTACFACLMLDGQIIKLGDELGDHPRGCCNTIAKVQGLNKPDWESGEEYFLNLPESEQIRLMGQTRFDLWKDNQAPLHWFVGEKFDQTWGSSPRLLNLKELKNIYHIEPKPKAPKASVYNPPTPPPPAAPKHFFDSFLRFRSSRDPNTESIIDHAFQKLDSFFHPTSALRQIKFEATNFCGNGVLGRFASDRDSQTKRRIPLFIEILERRTEGVINTVWHELGHYFDCELGVATGDYLSFEGKDGKGIAAMLFRALEQSNAMQVLKQAQKLGFLTPPGGGLSATADAGFTDYLCRPQEMFARAFSQWVTYRTQDPGGLRDIRLVLGGDPLDLETYSQWSDAEFQPIADAFDQMFGGLGWI